MVAKSKDLLTGAIFIALGGLFVVGSRGLETGTALRMGPGYFPRVLALAVLAIVLIPAVARKREEVFQEE